MERVVDLATRQAGSIAVSLVWDRDAETLRVIAYDGLTDEEIVVPVDGAEASEVYQHPFAYAGRAVARRADD
jgi:hypothetical protein